MRSIRITCALILLAVGPFARGGAAQIPLDTIYPGDMKLSMPFIGVDTVDGYKQIGDSITQTNTWIREVKPAMDGERSVLRITTTHISLPDSDITRNLLIIDANDLSLIHQEVRAASDSAMITSDSVNHVTGWNKLPKRDMMIVDRPLDRPVFPDDGIGPWLFGALPLKLKDRITMPQFNPWTGDMKFPWVHVVGDGDLNNGDVKVPCWIITVRGSGPPGYEVRRWISKNSRRLLKQTAIRGPDDPVYSSVNRHWF